MCVRSATRSGSHSCSGNIAHFSIRESCAEYYGNAWWQKTTNRPPSFGLPPELDRPGSTHRLLWCLVRTLLCWRVGHTRAHNITVAAFPVIPRQTLPLLLQQSTPAISSKALATTPYGTQYTSCLGENHSTEYNKRRQLVLEPIGFRTASEILKATTNHGQTIIQD